ncbi:glycerophosphodiester phosphodiesterase family protein [Formosa sp. PL04]|uniref:glycerophosphodiester phosphodiesterase family protein n=1 Tax=Formosa sp. PL04 TaxID=3081755 RepID=UPI002982A475|nr:glycerophosphodiester phosphodiesterase family protein [Formosa sp. PL04]MDW5290157.1 glycerophosphodiester phosphodiesterase family protein [Formosa sp. PL04]
MKKNIFLLLAITVISLTSYAQTTKLDSLITNYNNQDYVMVVSHRADRITYPENSIAAITKAIRIGVDIVELDVRETKDGELIIMHDGTIDRTTNGTGQVKDLDWSYLKSLYLKKGDSITKDKIPTLEEVFQLTKGKILIDLDFKTSSEQAVLNTYKLIEKYQMEQEVIFYLYDYKKVPKVYALNPNVKIMPRAYSAEDVENILKWDYITVIQVDDRFYTDELLKKAFDKGMRVWVNALGDYDDMERVEKYSGFKKCFDKKYINVIQTDFPQHLLDYLNMNNYRNYKK